jgi:uncharacterized protein (TIGR03083 family)
MSAEQDVWADAVLAVVEQLRRLWDAVPADGWSRPAAYVGWSCRETAEHIAGDFAHYAGQVLASPRDHYVAFGFDTSRATTPADLVEVVAMAGGMLAAAVRTADPASEGWHPHGFFGPTGFAAIGAAEGLVHGLDIAAGLGVAWSPTDRLVEQVLTAVFPDAARPAGPSPVDNLLARTGRGPHAVDRWTYRAAAVRPASTPTTEKT